MVAKMGYSTNNTYSGCCTDQSIPNASQSKPSFLKRIFGSSSSQSTSSTSTLNVVTNCCSPVSVKVTTQVQRIISPESSTTYNLTPSISLGNQLIELFKSINGQSFQEVTSILDKAEVLIINAPATPNQITDAQVDDLYLYLHKIISTFQDINVARGVSRVLISLGDYCVLTKNPNNTNAGLYQQYCIDIIEDKLDIYNSTELNSSVFYLRKQNTYLYKTFTAILCPDVWKYKNSTLHVDFQRFEDFRNAFINSSTICDDWYQKLLEIRLMASYVTHKVEAHNNSWYHEKVQKQALYYIIANTCYYLYPKYSGADPTEEQQYFAYWSAISAYNIYKRINNDEYKVTIRDRFSDLAVPFTNIQHIVNCLR